MRTEHLIAHGAALMLAASVSGRRLRHALHANQPPEQKPQESAKKLYEHEQSKREPAPPMVCASVGRTVAALKLAERKLRNGS